MVYVCTTNLGILCLQAEMNRDEVEQAHRQVKAVHKPTPGGAKPTPAAEKPKPTLGAVKSKPTLAVAKPSLPPGKPTAAATLPKPRSATAKLALQITKPTPGVATPTAAKPAPAAIRPKAGGMPSYLRRQVSDEDEDDGSGWDTDDAETPAPQKATAPAARMATAPVSTTASAAAPVSSAAAAKKTAASRNPMGGLLKRPGRPDSSDSENDGSGWGSDDGANGSSSTDLPVPDSPFESHRVATSDLGKSRGDVAADDAAATSKAHKRWIVETLKEHGGACSYELIVEVGETKHCDTVGAMLKFLKNGKVIKFNQIFLMYPMHKDEIITLIDQKYTA